MALIRPKIDVPIADEAPTDEKLTDYDRLHLITYIQLLDADAEGVPWREASRSLLHIDRMENLSAPNALTEAIWRERSG